MTRETIQVSKISCNVKLVLFFSLLHKNKIKRVKMCKIKICMQRKERNQTCGTSTISPTIFLFFIKMKVIEREKQRRKSRIFGPEQCEECNYKP